MLTFHHGDKISETDKLRRGFGTDQSLRDLHAHLLLWFGAQEHPSKSAWEKAVHLIVSRKQRQRE